MKTLSTSFYDVLGVGPGADAETIRKAYRRLARKHHPDVSADPRAHESMARINEAFEVLIDEGKRAEYDALLEGGTVFDTDTSAHREVQRPIMVRLTRRLMAHKTPVYAVAFTPDRNQLVSSAFDNEILWWGNDLDLPLRRTKLDSGVVSTLRPLPDDRLIAAGSAESHLTLYRLSGTKVEAQRQHAEEWASCVAIAEQGDVLAAGSLYRNLTVNRTQDGGTVYRRQEHEQSVTAVAFSRDGRLLATGSADATVRLYNARNGALVHVFRQVRSTVTSLTFSADNRFLAVSSVDLSVRVFSLRTGQIQKMMYGHTKPIESMAFHPNNWLLATASRDGTLGLWNASKGIGNLRLEVSTRPLSCVAFSADGETLAVGGQDRLVRVWEVIAAPQAG